MVDVSGQRKPVMPDYTGDTHDTLVVLRAHIRHLPLTCLYFRVADEQAFIVLLTAFAAYRDRRQYFHTRLHLGKHTSAVLLWSFFIRCHFFFHFQIRSSRCFLYSSLILSLCCSRCWRSTVSTYPPTEISPPAMSFTILRILPWTSRLI